MRKRVTEVSGEGMSEVRAAIPEIGGGEAGSSDERG
jgi:hypothetical protein